MENTTVTCDVCQCRHHVGCNKCELAQINVTEKCNCNTAQSVETPHFCQNFDERESTNA